MSDEERSETDLLGLVTTRYANDGYTVVMSPSSESLPAALRAFHLDAIAVGKNPHVIIEVIGRSEQPTERLAALRRAAEDAGGWRLDLILDRAVRTPIIARTSNQSIATTLSAVPQVAKIDARAAVLLGWGGMEALARSLHPDRFSRPQTPGRIVETLAEIGDISQVEATVLRKLAESRNAIIHGGLETQPSNEEMQEFNRILNRLRQLVSREKPSSRSPG